MKNTQSTGGGLINAIYIIHTYPICGFDMLINIADIVNLAHINDIVFYLVGILDIVSIYIYRCSCRPISDRSISSLNNTIYINGFFVRMFGIKHATVICSNAIPICYRPPIISRIRSYTDDTVCVLCVTCRKTNNSASAFLKCAILVRQRHCYTIVITSYYCSTVNQILLRFILRIISGDSPSRIYRDSRS